MYVSCSSYFVGGCRLGAAVPEYEGRSRAGDEPERPPVKIKALAPDSLPLRPCVQLIEDNRRPRRHAHQVSRDPSKLLTDNR
jgi:hypothetical protein